MPDWIKFPLALVVLCLVSGFLLASLNKMTSKKIAKLEKEKELKSRAIVLDIEKAEGKEIKKNITFNGKKEEFSYIEYKKNGKLIGYIAKGEEAGYSSVLKVIVGVKPNYKIHAIKVLSQKETPGLGDKVEEVLSKKTWTGIITGSAEKDPENLRPWFQIQFNGKKAKELLLKPKGPIDAITGATISSQAVVTAVSNAVNKLKTAVETK